MTDQKHVTPVYLLVADETPEFQTALKYAAYLAKAQKARLSILYLVEEPEIMPWGDIGRRMHYDALHEALDLVLSACDYAREVTGQMPCIYLEKHSHFDDIARIVEEDQNVTKLILGGDCRSKSPGPLVSYFTGKGLPKLRVPLTIVPGDMEV